MELYQIKKLHIAKETIMKMKRELTVWENIFANDTSDKGLISKIYRRVKRCSTSSPVREMQIKATIRYYLTPAKMAIINKSQNRCW